MLQDFITSFAIDEDGAVTVDWVVLTAAVVVLVGVAVTAVQTGTLTLTGSLFD